MSKPLQIGVTASTRGGRFMWAANRLAISRAGARAVRITPDRPYPIDQLDGLVIGGGDDIDGALYGSAAAAPTIRIDPERDKLELRVLDCAAKLGLPVLGICRGSQMINVYRGGTLHTDIYEVYEKAPRMRTVLPRKTILIEPDSRLRSILRQDKCRVNALHHQSIAQPGSGIRPVAHDKEGIVQAVEATDAPFLLGVQWHPEFLITDRHQQCLFRALVEAARRRHHSVRTPRRLRLPWRRGARAAQGARL